MLDAYSIKKIAPRILVGIVLLNISIYLVVALTDATRVIAQGAGRLMTAPFTTSDSYNFNLNKASGATQTEFITVGLVGGFFLGRHAAGSTEKGLSGIFKGIFSSKVGQGTDNTTAGTRGGNLGQALQMIIFGIVLPIVLILMAVLITLIFRQGLLLLLAISAPIACALYILPSTEKYARQWFELFTKTLLMYPIIILIFATSNILASVIFNSNSADSFPGLIAGMIAMFAPLALIPFSFKFAGGALASIYGLVTTGRSKLSEAGPLKKQRDIAKERWNSAKVQEGASQYRKASGNLREMKALQDKLDSGQTLTVPEQERLQRLRRRSFIDRRRRTAIGIGVFEKEAALNKAASDRARALIDFGDDEMLRAGVATARMEDVIDKDGNRIMDPATGKVAQRQVYRDLAGKEFTEDQVFAGRRAIGSNQYLLQQAIAHDMGKATLEGDWENMDNGLVAVQQQFGISNETMNSALIGAGFQQKGKTRQTKNMTVQTDSVTGQTKLNLDASKFVDEQWADRGTYQSMAATPDDIRKDAMLAAELVAKEGRGETLTIKENETLEKLSQVSDGFAAYGGDPARIQAGMAAAGQEVTPGAPADWINQAKELKAVLYVSAAPNPADPKYAGPGGPAAYTAAQAAHQKALQDRDDAIMRMRDARQKHTNLDMNVGGQKH